MLKYIRQGRPWAVVLGAHHEEMFPWAPYRSLELTVYPCRDGRIGRHREVRLGRLWFTWILSPGMCEAHIGFDTDKGV